MMGRGTDIDRFYMKLQRWNNYYKDKVLFSGLSTEEKKLLANNGKYKDLYKGKRCFVIGNGPSVNKIDFESLEKEVVITVNEMFRHEDFCKLKSNFHFLADPAFFKLRVGNTVEAETIEKMGLLSKSDTTLFIPLYSKRMVKRYGWYKKIDIHYFMNNLFFYDNYKEGIDFTRYIPSFQAVVQWGIAFAVYMGCSEIYLLGCDATNIVDDLSVFLKEDRGLSYAYALSADAVELGKTKRKKRGLELSLYGYWRIVHLFSELSHYCRRNKIGLYNCSQESILDSIPKRKIEDIL